MDLSKLLSTKEDLHADLVPYLVTEPFPMINSPLVQSIFHTTEMNAIINAQYKQKLAAIEKAQETKNWSSYIYMHERPYRLEAFLAVEDKMSDSNYWDILASIWTDCENPYINIEVWRSLMQANRHMSRKFMSIEDRNTLARLTDEITIYRRYTKGTKDTGISWTLDKDRAEWFANRFKKGGSVKKLKVKKSEIFAYLSSRGEDEIIYLGNGKN